jgi:putative DNA primase/helicase
MKFLEDVLPIKEDLTYFMTYLSIGLVGNLLELFNILTGKGRNGKSKLIELIKLTFGEYFAAVESQIFTRERPNANSPNPGLLNLMKKRIVIASEPEKNSKLNSGFIKFITGRDTTTLRNCHQNDMIEFTGNFLTFLICNDIPEVDEIDNALGRRLRSINFPSEFVDNPDPEKQYQKKINETINMKFKDWTGDFMLLLIDHYKKYSVTKILQIPPNVLKWTNIYKENTDIYLAYLNERTEESTSSVHMNELYKDFIVWFRRQNPQENIPVQRIFTHNIARHKEIVSVKIKDKVNTGIRKIKICDI